MSSRRKPGCFQLLNPRSALACRDSALFERLAIKEKGRKNGARALRAPLLVVGRGAGIHR